MTATRAAGGWFRSLFFPGFYKQFEDRPAVPWIMSLPFALIAFVLCVWGFVEMYCLKGSRKTNRFGPNPLPQSDTQPRREQHREVEMVPHKSGPPPVWRVKRGT